jgi:hypothetical protein
MRDFVLEELEGSPDWRVVLQAYQIPFAAGGESAANADGWLPRVRQIEGIEAAELPRLHGRLIALGLLSFEISGNSGVQYKISPLGRHALERGLSGSPTQEDLALTEESDADE